MKGERMKELVKAFSESIEDLIFWIFFPKGLKVCFQQVREPFDEEARQRRVAWSYFD